MSYFIKIDNREKAFIDFMTKDGYAFDVEPLDVGDIQFVDRTSKIPFIIIERKTYADLEASIKDGRYKEQKERMLKAYPYKVRKILLLEGDPSKFRMGKKTLNSVIVNSMIRDHISVYCCRDFAELCGLLETIILNLPKYIDELIKSVCMMNEVATFENELSAYTHSVKVAKKENNTPKICFRNMLCQINGISNSIADVIVEKYGHLYGFIEMLKTTHGEDYAKMSAEIGELKYGKGNGRKIGVVGTYIVSQIFGVDVSANIMLSKNANEEIPMNEKSGTKKKSANAKAKSDYIHIFTDE